MIGMKIKLALFTSCAILIAVVGVVNASTPEINIRTKMAMPSSSGCKSKWGRSCDVVQVVEADPGYIVCHILGNGYGGRGAEFHFSAIGALPNDASKYSQVKFSGNAPSNALIWNPWGSQVGYSHMGILEISMDASPSERKQHGCDV